jgi:hypothetical protein
MMDVGCAIAKDRHESWSERVPLRPHHFAPQTGLHRTMRSPTYNERGTAALAEWRQLARQAANIIDWRASSGEPLVED